MKPITHGSLLIVGAKATNLDVRLRENPRVILWDSQNQKWEGQSVPENVQAVFFTRWVGHKDFGNIMKDVRARNITVFNPIGTGLINKLAKELLNINDEVKTNHVKLPMTHPMTHQHKGKLKPLAQFVDPSKSDKQNAEFLFAKAQELSIPTTIKSMAVYASREKRRLRGVFRKPQYVTKSTPPKYQVVDAAVEIFDNILKELTDMREFLVKTVDENTALRTRIKKFKQYLDED